LPSSLCTTFKAIAASTTLQTMCRKTSKTRV
jgi:hypothetical protein